MEPFVTHTGRALPLRRTNVDTDQIIPAVYLKRVTREGFGDIFRNNSTKAGLLPIVLPEKVVSLIQDAAEAEPPAQVTVNLDAREVYVTGGGLAEDLAEPFQIDDYTRWRLMEGLDDIGLTLRHEDAITAFEATRPSFLPATL